MSISAKQSSVIDIFRCYLPILVVAFHTSSINGASVSHGVETYLRLAICKLGEIMLRLFVIVSVVAVFNLVGDLYDKGLRPVGILTDSSFFIYASHLVLITEISNFLLWRILPITAEWMLVLKVFLRPAVAVGICLLFL